MSKLRIGVVSLGEAGNLGDDLILLAVLESVYGHGHVDVAYLSHGRQLDLGLLTHLGLSSVPERRPVLPGYVHPARASQLFGDREAILFGGGGLLQTSHHPERPYVWLRYFPRRLVPILGVGLGIGPLATVG